ncbi:unnamed protein product [Camellia sinensis]
MPKRRRFNNFEPFEPHKLWLSNIIPQDHFHLCFASLACPDPDPDPDPGSSNAPRNQHPSGDQRPLPLSPTTYQSITDRIKLKIYIDVELRL